MDSINWLDTSRFTILSPYLRLTCVQILDLCNDFLLPISDHETGSMLLIVCTEHPLRCEDDIRNQLEAVRKYEQCFADNISSGTSTGTLWLPSMELFAGWFAQFVIGSND